MLEKAKCICKLVGCGVCSDYGVPEVDATVGRFIEQVTGGEKVVVDGVESYDSGRVKRVM